MKVCRYELTDKEWELIEPLICSRVKHRLHETTRRTVKGKVEICEANTT